MDEPLPFHSISRLLALGILRYFFWRTSFHHSFLPDMKRQTSLAPITLFISPGSLVPSPLFLSSKTLLQFTKLNFLPRVFPPCQRNFLSSLLMSFWMALRAKKMENEKIGQEETMEFIRVSLPTKLSHLDHQAWSLFLIF